MGLSVKSLYAPYFKPVFLYQSIDCQNVSRVLRDAIDVRGLLFHALPDVETEDLRVYRQAEGFARELIITGCVQRNEHSSRNIHSLAMRAEVLGFRFYLEGDTLWKILSEGQTCNDDHCALFRFADAGAEFNLIANWPVLMHGDR